MPELEFLADMNIAPLTVRQLRKLGWKIIRVSDAMDNSSKDIDILEYALDNDKVIITQDLDFSMLLAVGGYSRPSLINIRIENPEPDSVTNRIVETVSLIEQELKRGAVVTINETSAMYRNLPIELK